MEVEGGLGAGEVPERGGTSGAERCGGAECLEEARAVGDGGVEVVGVGEVELGLHPHQAVVVDVPGVKRDVTALGGEVLVGLEVLVVLARLEVGSRVGGEVIALDRFRDEPVELRGPDLPCHSSDLGVDPPRRLDRQRRDGVDGRLGHHPGSPRRHAAGVDLVPQTGEAVPQLESVADELLRRGGGDPQDGAELGDAVLRHQRAPIAGNGFLVVDARHGERGSVVDRAGRVQVGPPGGEIELTGRSSVLCPALTADGSEQAGGLEVVGDLACSASRPHVDHVFDSRRSIRQSSTSEGSR
ncbi:hypothetical protein [Nocardioides zeicaulis]|uniref:Uncharacterized protein n=1 Tax=Nocardioides zeicaulis TaxID=1776857 RepID=A0ABV6DWL9_9ACTN